MLCWATMCTRLLNLVQFKDLVCCVAAIVRRFTLAVCRSEIVKSKFRSDHVKNSMVFASSLLAAIWPGRNPKVHMYHVD